MCNLILKIMHDEPQIIKNIRNIITGESNIKFAYLFGSLAENKITLLSDTDIAVYLDGRTNHFKYRLKLIELLINRLKADNIDLVILNTAPPLLKYEVIKSNYVLKDDAMRRVPFEYTVLQEFLDTAYLRRVQRLITLEKIRKEEYFG